MNIHEYQAKELFVQFGIPAPTGIAVTSAEAIAGALDSLPSGAIMVKSQIHAGGRGKGTFTDGYQGGVKYCKTAEEAREAATAMLNNTLVTHQTGPAGREVQTLYFTEASDIEKEYYLAVVMDRKLSCPVIIASTEGGVDIEDVAANTPEKIVTATINPSLGIQAHHLRKIAFGLGFDASSDLSKSLHKQCCKLLKNLYRMFWETDAMMCEINPLVTTPTGELVALDAKVSFDENALYRHEDILALRDLNEEDEKEIEASKFDLSYVALDGNIACLVNGAGLAMSTMDIINHHGGSPANFLDVGGSATEEQVTAAFKIILSDPNVKGILVNIFGGIMKCDVIAAGVIAAAKAVEINVPLVVRLEGTNVEAGKQLLNESGLALTSADSLDDAAQKIVGLVKDAE